MISGGEIYKCASYGNIMTMRDNALGTYVGGTVGMASGGLVMNSYTQCNISVRSEKSYAGGIAGFCEGASIQNVYSLNKLNQRGSNTEEEMQIYAGGIVGYSDSGNISGAAAINPYVVTNGFFGEVCAYANGGYVDNNFYYERLTSSALAGENAVHGYKTALKVLETLDFYINPVENGGLLGWSGSDEGVWERSSRLSYPFPVLCGVKNQNIFMIPEEYRGLR